MRNTLLSIIITSLFFSSCSNSESNSCDEVLEPEGNEFTYNCKRYETQAGLLRFSGSTKAATTCWLEFINEPYTNFENRGGDSHINYIRIWLLVPYGSIALGSIPTGTYTLQNNSTKEEVFQIADANTVAFDAHVSQGGSTFNSSNFIGDDFDEATVNISKSGDIYTINYTMIDGNKTVKGKYVGTMLVKVQ